MSSGLLSVTNLFSHAVDLANYNNNNNNDDDNDQLSPTGEEDLAASHFITVLRNWPGIGFAPQRYPKGLDNFLTFLRREFSCLIDEEILGQITPDRVRDRVRGVQITPGEFDLGKVNADKVEVILKLNGQFFSTLNDKRCHFILAGNGTTTQTERVEVEVWKNGKNGRKMLGQSEVEVKNNPEVTVKIKKKDSKVGHLKMAVKLLNEDKNAAKDEIGAILSEGLSRKLGEFFSQRQRWAQGGIVCGTPI